MKFEVTILVTVNNENQDYTEVMSTVLELVSGISEAIDEQHLDANFEVEVST